MSTLTWLDYSEQERRKMLDVIDLFRERETRDELGIGSVRDAVADTLFPGTSTIMTRARYFLIVPWLYRRLEERRVSSAEVGAKARSAELDLVTAIAQSRDNDGLIGKRAKRRLKRLPSSVYWQGLRTWGICTFPGDQFQYHRSLDPYYRALEQSRRRAPGPDEEHDEHVFGNWHGGLVPQPAEFPSKCSLTLLKREARYLFDRIRLHPLCANTVLAELAATRRRTAIAFVWEHPSRAELRTELREQLEHAQNFSETLHGPVLLYNLVLAEQTKREEAVKGFTEMLQAWVKIIEGRWQQLTTWDRSRFWQLVLARNPHITAGAREFINSWLTLLLEQRDPAALKRSTAARDLIRTRERRLKKSLARIDNPRAGELWNGASGIYQIDFRWGVTQRILSDIFAGLEAVDA